MVVWKRSPAEIDDMSEMIWLREISFSSGYRVSLGVEFGDLGCDRSFRCCSHLRIYPVHSTSNMAPPAAVSAVRYSALVFGVLYGIVHRRTLQSEFDQHAAQKEVQLRENWLKQAKEAWAKKQANSDGLVTDPDAPGFDLEKLLQSFEK